MRHLLRRLTLATALLGTVALPLAAQTPDPCAAVVGTSDTVYTGRPSTVTWQAQAQVPISATDSTLVPQRLDGFYLALDGAVGAARVDTGKLTPVTCASGLLGFKFTLASGVAKGSHTVAVVPYNFTLDPVTQVPTLTRQEGAWTLRPFVAIDPVQAGPPQAVTAAKVWR